MDEDERIPSLENWLSEKLNEPVKLVDHGTGGFSYGKFIAWRPHGSVRVTDADLYNKLAVAAGVKQGDWQRMNGENQTPYWSQRTDNHVNWTFEPDHNVKKVFLRKYGVQHGLVKPAPTLSEQVTGALSRFAAYLTGK